MIKENRSKVNEYLEDEDKSLLTFAPPLKDYEVAKLVGKRSEAVLFALILFVNHASKNDSDTIETPASRRRGAVDIYRHLKVYRPKLTIFGVMQSLWEVREELFTNYCFDIHKRVFLPKRSSNSREENHKDEFGLVFSDWADI